MNTNKRFKINSYKVPNHENERIISDVELLEEFNPNSSKILIYIEIIQDEYPMEYEILKKDYPTKFK